MDRWLFTASLILFLSSWMSAMQDNVPRFEPGECAIEVPKGETPRCGYLVVRENRSSASKRTIHLPVIILKSSSAEPKPDPVLRTLGGPGGSSLRLARGRRSSPWLADRDYIIFEQRGTKYAQPALECPEVDTAIANSAKSKLDRRSARRNEVNATKVISLRSSSGPSTMPTLRPNGGRQHLGILRTATISKCPGLVMARDSRFHVYRK